MKSKSYNLKRNANEAACLVPIALIICGVIMEYFSVFKIAADIIAVFEHSVKQYIINYFN